MPDAIARPPLGIMPQRFWIERRIIELMRASLRHADDPNVRAVPQKYLRELKELLTHPEMVEENL